MVNRVKQSRFAWMAAGLIAGLCISYFWPHEPAQAVGNDRNDKFGMLTTPMGGNAEGVFTLNYLTGQLTGAVYNPTTGQFGHVYSHSVASDFGLDNKSPQYAFVAGQAALKRSRELPFPSASIIYVAELKSGKVVAYGVNYPRNARQFSSKLTPLGIFPFAEATPTR